jgi:hypothetical protein
MNRYFLLLGVLIILLSCNRAPNDILNIEKTWIYVELEVATEDTDYYYYFGQINQNILDKLAIDQNYKSLFVLSNVRYNDDYDKIQVYADESDNGTLFFRTEDIVKIEVLNNDPLNRRVKEVEKDSLSIKR